MNEENVFKCPNCGEYKQENHDSCFLCSLESLQVSECPQCGGVKNADYDKCKQCFDNDSKKSKNSTAFVASWCECGELKKPEFENCFMCSKRIQKKAFDKFSIKRTY